MEKNLSNYLKKNKVKYKIHKHEAVFTVQESERIKAEIPGLRTKALFLKDKKAEKFYLVCLPGGKRLNINILKEKLKAGKIEFASPEEMKNELNVSPGNVSLFCMINTKRTILIVDKEVWEAEIAGFHPNRNTATLEVTRENVRRFYDSLTMEKHILEL